MHKYIVHLGPTCTNTVIFALSRHVIQIEPIKIYAEHHSIAYLTDMNASEYVESSTFHNRHTYVDREKTSGSTVSRLSVRYSVYQGLSFIPAYHAERRGDICKRRHKKTPVSMISVVTTFV